MSDESAEKMDHGRVEQSELSRAIEVGYDRLLRREQGRLKEDGRSWSRKKVARHLSKVKTSKGRPSHRLPLDLSNEVRQCAKDGRRATKRSFDDSWLRVVYDRRRRLSTDKAMRLLLDVEPSPGYYLSVARLRHQDRLSIKQSRGWSLIEDIFRAHLPLSLRYDADLLAVFWLESLLNGSSGKTLNSFRVEEMGAFYASGEDGLEFRSPDARRPSGDMTSRCPKCGADDPWAATLNGKLVVGCDACLTTFGINKGETIRQAYARHFAHPATLEQ